MSSSIALVGRQRVKGTTSCADRGGNIPKGKEESSKSYGSIAASKTSTGVLPASSKKGSTPTTNTTTTTSIISMPHQLKRKTSNVNLEKLTNKMRSVDDFLESAAKKVEDSSAGGEDGNYVIHPRLKRWRYTALFLCLGVANSADAAEILCLSYILSDTSFQNRMLQKSSFRAGFLAATVFLGMLIGGLLVGCLGDWWGRRPLLLGGLMTGSITGILSAICPDVWTLSLCRFVAGLGIGATVPPLFALCSELSPPADRGFWVTIAASFWMVGSIYVAVMGWIILGNHSQESSTNPDIPNVQGSNEEWMDAFQEHSSIHWRVFATFCALPSALGCVLVYNLVPESPRFLLLQHRYTEALSVLNHIAGECLVYRGEPISINELKYHYPPPPITIIPGADESFADNYIDDDDQAGLSSTVSSSYNLASSGELSHPPPTSIFSRGRTSVPLLSTVQVALNDFAVSSSQLYRKDLKSTTWPLQLVWFSLSFGSYGLLTWINTLFEEVHLKNVYFNALLFSLSNLPGNLIAAFFMDKIGRSRLLTGGILAAALSLVAFAYQASNVVDSTVDETDSVSQSSRRRTMIILSACSFQCFTVAAWNTIDVLTSELFPTSVRATGMGVCAATGRIGAMVAQFVNGWLVSHPTRLLLVAAFTLVLGSITPQWLPADQSGKPIQDYAGNGGGGGGTSRTTRHTDGEDDSLEDTNDERSSGSSASGLLELATSGEHTHFT